jgi:hypothetical protein
MLDALFTSFVSAAWDDVGSPVVAGVGWLLLRSSNGWSVSVAWFLSALTLVLFWTAHDIPARHLLVAYAAVGICPLVAFAMSLALAQNRLSRTS